MEILNKKKILRKDILDKRRIMHINEKKKIDRIILNKLYESKYYIEAKNIFVYISYDTEINTKDIIDKCVKDDKKVYVPRTEFKTKIMEAVEIKSLDNLKVSNYGILEPDINEPCINPNEIDLVIVPGVAFDRFGGRLGYGAGFYDRYFKRINIKNEKKIIKLALAYDFQILDKIPTDENDVPIDYILTDKESIKVKY